MKIGLHLSDLTYPSGPGGLADDLTHIVVAAEEAGFARVSVMDHVWQIAVHGPPEHDMLEAYTTLGYIAARTNRVDLVAWVTAVSYRPPERTSRVLTSLASMPGVARHRRGLERRGSGGARARLSAAGAAVRDA